MYVALAKVYALAAGVGAMPSVGPQPVSSLVVHAVRAYRPAQGRTEVNAFMQIPYMLLEPTTDGPEGALSYKIQVKVADSTGLTLLQNSWQNHAPAAMRAPNASAVDMVRFSLAPGRYRLTVTVQDSVSGHQVESDTDLEGFASEPAASDLLLSPSIRPATATDSVPRPAELRWGEVLVTAAATLELTPLRAVAYYLIEAYADQNIAGTLSFRVTDSSQAVLLRTPPERVQVPQGGGVLKGQLDLAGLPGGTYTLTSTLALGSKQVERSSTFTMANLGETLARDASRREAAANTDEGYFASMRSEALDAAEEPLQAIAVSSELSAYNAKLSVNGKRRFLTEFWQRRDPDPATPQNQARESFYQWIQYANEHYREGGRSRPGWKTDRGRVYLRNGPPDEVLQRSQQAKAPPYEVWRYRTGKDRWYCFADRSLGVGLYQLISSNDVREPGLPNWQEILTPEGLQDVGRFLQIDFFTTQRNY
jgi:GWxTD domain-containing protein